MKCKYENRLNDYNFCEKEFYYCTYQQENNCKMKHPEYFEKGKTALSEVEYMSNDNWIFKNDPFEILNIAFKRLFPNVKYNAYFDTEIKDEYGERVFGFTDFKSNGEITIVIDGNLSVENATEIFAHELAHAGVGKEHGHDEEWNKAFDDLYNEYNKIGSKMFLK